MFGSLSPCQALKVTASVLVKKATGMATLTGLLCTESSSMIINVWDGQDAAGTLGPTTKIVGPLTLVAGTPYPMPVKLNNGLYFEVASGSGSFTAFFD